MENKQEQNNLEQARKDLFISQESEFFVAIGYLAPMSHSLIFIGVRDKRTKKIFLLNATGKYYDTSKPVSCVRVRSFFSEVPARLREEAYLFDEDEVASITYQAYTISENQYLDYLNEISHCSRSRYLGAYHPDLEANTQDGTTKYIYNGLPLNDDYIEAPINQRIKKLSINNNCRHAAKELVADTLHQPNAQLNISSFFLSPLRCATKIYKGEIIDQFFIFPIPPSKNTLTPEIYQILAKIFHQLESISHSYLKNDNTFKKFNVLKELYVELDTRKNVGMLQLFDIIDEWDAVNQNLIDAKRGFSLFKHTATRSMLLEIKQMQQQHRP